MNTLEAIGGLIGIYIVATVIVFGIAVYTGVIK